MLIEHLRVSGLLSFGPTGIDLPLGKLNVLIGPNGSGKSNLLEVLSLLKAAPTRLANPIKDSGGIHAWLWQGNARVDEGTIDATVQAPEYGASFSHSLTIGERGGRFELLDESIGTAREHQSEQVVDLEYHYRFQRGNPEIREQAADGAEDDGGANKPPVLRDQPVLYSTESRIRRLDRRSLRPEESILSQIRDPERYPVLTYLGERYARIRLYRNWTFGPYARVRQGARADEAGDFLLDGGENLPLVLSQFPSDVRTGFVTALQELYDGIKDYQTPVHGGQVSLYLEEQGGRRIPAVRLSDGTLRYLCLLAILLHPDPPPFIAIEEPELGLHPDVIPQLAKLLVAASERTQLVITTHSDVLVDALSSQPESIIVCEKADGESQFRRLEAGRLKEWLESYTLGQLWSMGEIGGNRW